MIGGLFEQIRNRPLLAVTFTFLASLYVAETSWVLYTVVVFLWILLTAYVALVAVWYRRPHMIVIPLAFGLATFTAWVWVPSPTDSEPDAPRAEPWPTGRFVAILTGDFDPRTNDGWSVDATVVWNDVGFPNQNVVLYGHGDLPDAQPQSRVLFLGHPLLPNQQTNPGFLGNPYANPKVGIGVDTTTGLVCYADGDSDRCGHSARTGLIQRLHQGLSADAYSVTIAMLLGAARDITPELRDRFADTGTSHLLAISGLHMAWVAMLLFFCCRRLLNRFTGLLLRGTANKLAWVVTTIGCILFTLLTGSHIPTVRACCMIALLAWAALRDHDHDTLSWWAAAALTIAIWEPAEVWGASFQLSFAAVFGLLISTPTVSFLYQKLGWDDAHQNRIRRWVLGTLCSCFAAWLATAPISIYHFGFVSLGAPLINAVVVPYVTLFWMPCSVLGLTFVLIGWPWGESVGLQLIEWANGGLFGLLDRLIFLSETMVVGRPSGVWLFLTTIAVFVVLSGTDRHRSIRLTAWVVCIVGVIWLVFQSKPIDRLRITYLDVGHGDAAIVECPGAAPIVIDAGGTHRDPTGMGRYAVVPSLHALGISSLSAVVNTHADLDHIGGLVTVLQRRDVDHLWWNGQLTASPLQWVLLSTAIFRGLDPFAATLDPRFGLGECTIETLAPPDSTRTASWSENNRSLVLRIGYGRHRFLFTGDIEQAGEEWLLHDPGKLTADVVKVAHHGSKTSSSTAFIRATGASLAIVSCNQHGAHGLPDEEVLTRWKQHGTEVLRTDVDGAVTLESDGVRLWKNDGD